MCLYACLAVSPGLLVYGRVPRTLSLWTCPLDSAVPVSAPRSCQDVLLDANSAGMTVWSPLSPLMLICRTRWTCRGWTCPPTLSNALCPSTSRFCPVCSVPHVAVVTGRHRTLVTQFNIRWFLMVQRNELKLGQKRARRARWPLPSVNVCRVVSPAGLGDGHGHQSDPEQAQHLRGRGVQRPQGPQVLLLRRLRLRCGRKVRTTDWRSG